MWDPSLQSTVWWLSWQWWWWWWKHLHCPSRTPKDTRNAVASTRLPYSTWKKDSHYYSTSELLLLHRIRLWDEAFLRSRWKRMVGPWRAASPSSLPVQEGPQTLRRGGLNRSTIFFPFLFFPFSAIVSCKGGKKKRKKREEGPPARGYSVKAVAGAELTAYYHNRLVIPAGSTEIE